MLECRRIVRNRGQIKLDITIKIKIIAKLNDASKINTIHLNNEGFPMRLVFQVALYFQTHSHSIREILFYNLLHYRFEEYKSMAKR